MTHCLLFVSEVGESMCCDRCFEVRGQLEGVGSLLPSIRLVPGFDLQGGWQGPLAAEQSLRPCLSVVGEKAFHYLPRRLVD